MDKSKIEMCQNCTKILPIKRTLLDIILQKPKPESELCGGPVQLLKSASVSYGPGFSGFLEVKRTICSKDLTVNDLTESLQLEIKRVRTEAVASKESDKQWDALTDEEKQRSLDTPVAFII